MMPPVRSPRRFSPSGFFIARNMTIENNENVAPKQLVIILTDELNLAHDNLREMTKDRDKYREQSAEWKQQALRLLDAIVDAGVTAGVNEVLRPPETKNTGI